MRKAKKATEFSNCSSCGAEIFWCRTRKDKSMPVDVKPTSDGKFVLTLTGGEYGHLLCEQYYEPKHAQPARNRYTAHWATCPNAEEHRRKT